MAVSMTKPACQYYISHSFWRHDYDVTAADGRHLFHVHNSQWSPGKPSLTLHASSDTSGPVVGACKYRHLSSRCEVCLGDPCRSNAAWESMVNLGFMSVKYSYPIYLEDGRVLRVTWKKTHSMGSGHSGNLKMVDDATDKVLAVFSSGGIFTMKTGHFEIYANYGERFNLMTLITGLAMREKQRRDAQNSGAAGAGAGAGAGGAGA